MLRIYDIQKTGEVRECRLSAKIDCPQAGWQGFSLWFSFPAAYADRVTLRANPFLAGVLFAAMKLRQDIHIEGTVSRKMLRGVKTIMDILHQWFPDYRPAAVSADQIEEIILESAHNGGCFFSGGVDSFYTVLKNKNSENPEFRITHLIFTQGLDIPLENENFYAVVLEHIRQISVELGLELVLVKTNIRQLTNPWLDWQKVHGSALAAIGLCMEPLFRAVFIPCDHSYNYKEPRGTHPLTDPLWSTESLRFIHDGAEADRVEKVCIQIAQSQVALDHLRVCWQNVDGKYNCGRCEKCLRTKINLYLAGALDRCRTFEDSRIDLSRIETMTIREEYVLDFVCQNYNALVQKGGDVKLSDALKKAIHSYDVYHRKKHWKTRRRQFRGKLKETVISLLRGIPGLKGSR